MNRRMIWRRALSRRSVWLRAVRMGLTVGLLQAAINQGDVWARGAVTAGVAKKVMRADLYEEAMKEIGYAHGGPSMEPEKLFDGVVFDPAKPEEYARSFAVGSVKG